MAKIISDIRILGGKPVIAGTRISVELIMNFLSAGMNIEYATKLVSKSVPAKVDENFPPTLISYLQKNHHDVKRILRSAKGTSDINVRKIATKDNRIILSFDKDFLKTEDENKSFSIVVFDFPYMKPMDIIPI